MAELKPVADIEVGLWKPTSGTSLYPMMAEEPRDDTTYIFSASSPATSSPVIIRGSSDAVQSAGVTALSATIHAATQGGDDMYCFCFFRSDPTGPTGWKQVGEKRESTSTVFQWVQLFHKVAAGTPGTVSPDAGTTVTVNQAAASAIGLEILSLYAQNGQPVIIDKIVMAEISHANTNPGSHTIQKMTVDGPSRLALAVSVCASGPGPNDPRDYYNVANNWPDTGVPAMSYHRLTIGYRSPAQGEILGEEAGAGTSQAFTHATSPHNAIEMTMTLTNDQGGGVNLPSGLLAFYRNDNGFNQSALSSGTTPNILDRISDYSGNRYHAPKGGAAGSDAADPTWNATGLSYFVDDYATLPAALLTAWAAATANYTLIFLARWNTLSTTLPLISPNSTTITAGLMRNNGTFLEAGIGDKLVAFGTLAANTWAMVHARRDGVNGSVGINGVTSGTNTTIANGTAPTTMTLGANAAAARFFDGDQACMLLFNRALTNAELTTVYSWVKNNIAIPRGITTLP